MVQRRTEDNAPDLRYGAVVMESDARKRLRDAIDDQNRQTSLEVARSDLMRAHADETVAALLSRKEGRCGTLFPASEYAALCKLSSVANRSDGAMVSIVLPLDMAQSEITPESRADDDDPDSSYVTFACTDISPHTAFILAAGLPLRKPTREALEDNGLSLRTLTLREAVLAARRTVDGIGDDDPADDPADRA